MSKTDNMCHFNPVFSQKLSRNYRENVLIKFLNTYFVYRTTHTQKYVKKSIICFFMIFTNSISKAIRGANTPKFTPQ